MGVGGNLARELNRRMLAHVAAGTTDLAPGTMFIEAESYRCEQRHQREREQLFGGRSQLVAFSAELPDSPSWLPLTVCGVPVLLTRDAAGRLHAFRNACAHRAAQLVETAGQGHTVSCPFHGWSYTLDGRLRGRRAGECFGSAEEQVSLVRLGACEVAGLVFLGLTPEAEAALPGAAFAELSDQLGALQMADMTLLERRSYAVAANWKLVTELSLESYHFKSLHRDSVATILYDNAVVDCFTDSTRWAFPLADIGRLETVEEQHWPEQLQGSCTYTLAPGVMLVVNASGVQMIRAEPAGSPGACRVSYVGIAEAGGDRDAALRAYAFGGDVFANEDLPAAESMQRNLDAGVSAVHFGRNEPLLQFWHRFWDDALG